MLLDTTELFELEGNLRQEFEENLTGILSKLNRSEKIEEFLAMMNLSKLLKSDTSHPVYKTGKIIVIGQSEIKNDLMISIGRKFGINKERFELYLEYEDAKKFNFNRIKWKPEYALIMVGPMPHSGSDKGDYSSVISAIENEEGYPPVIRLGTNGLKITKSDFRDKLRNAVENGLIRCDSGDNQ